LEVLLGDISIGDKRGHYHRGTTVSKPGPGCCVDRRQKDFLVVENETAETNRLSNFHRFPEL
jgi:hypothetical protein